jgi:isopenicillin-N N-acyltransferase-like protein
MVTREKSLIMIRVRGTPREMGQQIGEAAAQQIHGMLHTYKRTFEEAYDDLEMTWDDAILQARKYYPFAMEYTPQYVEELKGIAEGSDTALDDLLVINCAEAILSDALILGCTSIGVSAERTENGHVLTAHNEDWLPDDEENTFLVHATPDGEPPYLGVTYGGLLVNVGFNAAGIAQCCDSVYPTDVRVGVPRIFVSRGTLAATKISDAIRTVLMPGRAAGYNHLIAHESGELYNIEVSARHFATLYGMDGILAHTNNYLTKRMKEIEHNTHELIGSRVRVNRALRLLRNKGKNHSVETLREILSDHVNFPNSICSHSDLNEKPLDRQKTMTTLIMDLTAREMHACWGNPCESEFTTYRLDAS